MKPLKPIFYVSVMTSNRGDMAIRESIASAIKKRINIPFAYFNVKYDKLTAQRIEQLKVREQRLSEFTTLGGRLAPDTSVSPWRLKEICLVCRR